MYYLSDGVKVKYKIQIHFITCLSRLINWKCCTVESEESSTRRLFVVDWDSEGFQVIA